MSPSADTPVLLENRCYDELKVGDSASLTRVLTKDDIELFAILSGDVNPAHLDEAYARDTPFHKVIAHGMWGGTLISTVLGTKLPGPGTIYVGQQLRFVRPVGLGDVITVTVTVKEKRDKNMVLLDCVCSNQLGKPVITGEAEVMAPSVKVQREAQPLPELHLHRHERFAQLMALTTQLPAIRCAVVYPDSVESLMAALDAARSGLILPLLVGPRARLEALAQAHGLDLSGCEWEEATSASAVTPSTGPAASARPLRATAAATRPGRARAVTASRSTTVTRAPPRAITTATSAPMVPRKVLAIFQSCFCNCCSCTWVIVIEVR